MGNETFYWDGFNIIINYYKRIQTCPSSLLHTQTRCRPVHARGFTAGQKTVENQDQAAGPSLLWAAGPSRALGQGPLGLQADMSRACF